MKRLTACLIALIVLLSLSPLSALAQAPLNILLLGTDELGDAVTGQEEDSRADAIFLLSIRPGKGGFRVLSVERDYLVELPNEGPNKLGTATYFGGPELGLSAVRDLLKLDVDYYAQIDIQNVIKAVDLIGGLDIEVFEDEVDQVNSFIDGILAFEGLHRVHAGMNHLTGPEAWAFMGVRDNDMDSVKSNAQRNGRQQRIMTAGMEKLSAMKLEDAMNLANEILPLIKTNISLSKVMEIIQMVYANDMKNIDYLYTPKGEYQVRTVRMHRVVILKDMDQEVQTISDFLNK